MSSHLVHGLTRIRGHCVFAWTETVDSRSLRSYELAPNHCEACVSELRTLHAGATFVETSRGMSEVDNDTNPSPPVRAQSAQKSRR